MSAVARLLWSRPSPAKQQTWDKPIMQRKLSQLMERQAENYDMPKFLASAYKHSDDWLLAIPISSCSLHLDDEVIKIVGGLRWGLDICKSHTCVCGAMDDVRGFHALSSKRSFGRLIRHNHVNNVIHHSVSQAGSPGTKEPAGLMRTDGKRPDRLTLIPWREGRCFSNDATVAETKAASYLPSTAMSAGSATESESAAARRDKVCGVVVSLRVYARRLRNARILLQKDYVLRFRTGAVHIGHYNGEDGNVFPLSNTLYRSPAI